MFTEEMQPLRTHTKMQALKEKFTVAQAMDMLMDSDTDYSCFDQHSECYVDEEQTSLVGQTRDHHDHDSDSDTLTR